MRESGGERAGPIAHGDELKSGLAPKPSSGVHGEVEQRPAAFWLMHWDAGGIGELPERACQTAHVDASGRPTGVEAKCKKTCQEIEPN